MAEALKPVIPGGPTDLAAKQGGDELSRKLQLLLAGETVNSAMFALISAVGILAVTASDDIAEAERLIDVFAADAKGFAVLNDAEFRRQIATYQTGGHS